MRHRPNWPTLILVSALFAVAALTTIALEPVHGQATAPLHLVMDPASPAGPVVGQPVRLTVEGAFAAGNSPRFRFRTAPVGEPLRLLRDFQAEGTAVWTPYEEGDYSLEVAVLNSETGEIITSQQTVVVAPRVSAGEKPVLSPTEHPLVFLYSAPPCSSGMIRVHFTQFFSTNRTSTHWRPCSDKSTNFYLAGMLPNTGYVVQDQWTDGTDERMGPRLTLHTGSVAADLPVFSLRDAPDSRSSRTDAIVLHSISGLVGDDYFPVATDIYGRPIWYHRFIGNGQTASELGVEYLVQPLPAGPETPGSSFLALTNRDDAIGEFMREIDLAGNSIFETNVEQVNRQLVARGDDPVVCFNHEAQRLPNGQTVVLAYVLGDLPPDVSSFQEQAVGEMIIALDQDAQVVWTWNPFDHLDIQRQAVLDQRWLVAAICNTTPISRLTPDWTHANAIDYSPRDGSLLLSLRHQDWVIKIDYDNGAGRGEVLWRLGKDGDFAVVADPSIAYPWFSHQHDARWDTSAGATNTIILFDNGNTRCLGQTVECNSRGQVWKIDEVARTATLLVNADLGLNSSRFGSAQRLSNGNYHFLAGIVYPGAVSRSIEVGVSPPHRTNYVLEADQLAYRTWRMPDLYAMPSATAVTSSVHASELFLPLIQQ